MPPCPEEVVWVQTDLWMVWLGQAKERFVIVGSSLLFIAGMFAHFAIY